MPGYFDGPRPLDMIATEANGSRSRDAVTVTGSAVLPPGTLLAGTIPGNFTAATSPAAVTAILLYWADPTAGPVQVAALTRDAEVNDAYLIYNAMDPIGCAAALRLVGIIVRKGVLVNPVTPFAMSRASWPGALTLSALEEETRP